MSTAELQERPVLEIELVEQWRALSLARAGYDLESAAVLARLARGRPARRDAPARARVLRRSRLADPPLGADPPAPGRPAGAPGVNRACGLRRHRPRRAEYGRMSLLASIPSPSSGTVDLGPFQIHMYGLTLLAAIAVCIWITGHRYRQPRRRLGPHLPLRRLGRRRGHRRRTSLPPRHELERGARPVVGAVRDLEGRARRLGRDRPRLHRRRDRRQAGGRRRLPSSPTASRPACSSRRGRQDRQLVEPGAVRQGDRPSLGARDRPGPPAVLVDRRRAPTTRPSSTSCSGTSSPRRCSCS